MFRDEKEVVAVTNRLLKLANRIEKRVKEISQVLQAVKAWMKEYEPTMVEAKKDYESKFRRITRI